MDAPTPAKWATSSLEREDLDFVRGAESAIRDAPSRKSFNFIMICVALFATFFAWAYFAELEEVTRGEGKVVPSSKTQVLQSLEGGIVKEILAREGAKVKKGQVLLRIDDIGFRSDFGGLEAKELTLLAQTHRLRAEAARADMKEIEFPNDLRKRAANLVRNEITLFKIRRSNLDNQISVLKERLLQRKQELAELKENRRRFSEGRAIAQKEMELKAPLAKRGIVSKTDVLKLERELSNLKGELARTEQSIPRVQASIREAGRLIEEQRLSFRQNAQAELNSQLGELWIVQQSLRAAKDKVVRADIRSPVDGVINKLHFNTIGGVVRASEPLVEITPLEDTLLVEVRIRPSDIAFLSPTQKALVKLSAYDFTIYGGLDGKVEIISSDSIYDEAAKESYYLVTVRTKESSLRRGKESLPIIPGMVATVDVITGSKSVLDYLLKPILKARYEALRER